MFFERKKRTEIRWDFNSNQETTSKITIVIASIKPFKRSFFGVMNSPAASDFVPDAMEIIGEIKSMEGPQLNTRTVLFLVPEQDITHLKAGDLIEMWLSKSKSCFKFEKR